MKRQRTLLGRLQATSRGGCEARALHATTRRLLELTRAHVRAYNLFFVPILFARIQPGNLTSVMTTSSRERAQQPESQGGARMGERLGGR